MEQNSLAHYGVLGMKWGVRKNPDRAIKKSLNKLRSIDKKRDKLTVKVGQRNVRASKFQVRADIMKSKALRTSNSRRYAKRTEAARKLEAKSNKQTLKARKGQLKSAKLQRKGAAWVQNINKEFANVPLSQLSKEDIAYARKWAVAILDS